MNAQGSQIFDTSYINSLTDQVNQIDICADLQAFEQRVMSEIQAQISAVEAQMAFLEPIVEILQNPEAALDKIVEWIGKFIESVLKPIYQPYLTMVSQIEQAVQAVANLTAAIENAANRIGSCVVSAPGLILSDATNSIINGTNPNNA